MRLFFRNGTSSMIDLSAAVVAAAVFLAQHPAAEADAPLLHARADADVACGHVFADAFDAFAPLLHARAEASDARAPLQHVAAEADAPLLHARADADVACGHVFADAFDAFAPLLHARAFCPPVATNATANTSAHAMLIAIIFRVMSPPGPDTGGNGVDPLHSLQDWTVNVNRTRSSRGS